MSRALIITPFFRPNIGGAETFAEDLAKELSKKYLVHICTVKLDKPIVFEGMDYKKAFYLIRKLFVSLARMKGKYKYDRVYALGLMSSFLCMVFKVRFNAVILNLMDKSFWIPIVLNSADTVFVEGNNGKNNLINIGIREEKIKVFNHWCDQSVFTWKERNNVNMKVLFVGRPIKPKGKHIIEECQRMTQGIDYEYIENCAYEDLPKHYQIADVVVVPSLCPESYTKVVVEAASCGCAVITSNKGSLPEQVRGFGRIIDPTPENFKELLKKLNKNRNALEQIKLNTLIYSKEHFNEKNAEIFF